MFDKYPPPPRDGGYFIAPCCLIPCHITIYITSQWGKSHKQKDTMDTHSHPEIIQMQVQFAELTKKVDHHDRLLVTGSDEQLSLPELVRALTLTVNSYITRKEREEEDERKVAEKKKEQWEKWKWLVLGVVVPAILLFLYQSFLFFIKFVPIMINLSESGQ